MKRCLTHLLIAGYLGALAFGVFSHAVGFKTYDHTAMYFLVWDMYCGWSAYESHMHVIGEGYSGRHYELVPAPWGEFPPFQTVGRQDFDTRVRFLPAMAELTLRNTEHEPIRQIVIIEEAWSKKYNLPDALWGRRYGEPKQKRSYFHLRSVFAPGTPRDRIERSAEWPEFLAQRSLMDNPRLVSDISRGHAMFAIDPLRPSKSGVTPAAYTPFPNSP